MTSSTFEKIGGPKTLLGLVMIAIAVPLVIFGKAEVFDVRSIPITIMDILVAIVVAGFACEITAIISTEKIWLKCIASSAAFLMLYLAFITVGQHKHEILAIISTLVVIVASTLVFTWKKPETEKPDEWIKLNIGVFSLICVPGVFALIPMIRKMEHGMGWTFFLFLTVIGADYGGRLFGKTLGGRWNEDRTKWIPGKWFYRPLHENASPNKTIEGLLGGIFMSMVGGLIVCLIAQIPGFTIWEAVLFSVLVSLAAAAGDLTGSIFKRTFGVKDSSKALGSHGGIIDRTVSFWLGAAMLFTVLYLWSGD